jgi:hypothetical protein
LTWTWDSGLCWLMEPFGWMGKVLCQKHPGLVAILVSSSMSWSLTPVSLGYFIAELLVVFSFSFSS